MIMVALAVLLGACVLGATGVDVGEVDLSTGVRLVGMDIQGYALDDGNITLDDVPAAVNEALFGGDDLDASEMLLSVLVIVCVALPLSMAGLDMSGLAIVLIAVIGLLTFIGWVEYWLLFLAGLLIAAMWAGKVRSGLTGG